MLNFIIGLIAGVITGGMVIYLTKKDVCLKI